MEEQLEKYTPFPTTSTQLRKGKQKVLLFYFCKLLHVYFAVES